MKDKFLITGEDKMRDFSRNIVIAASSIIPGVGGVLSLFLDKYLPDVIDKRKNDFLLDLAKDFEKMPQHIVEKISTDEEFFSITLKIFKAITQEEKEIKINSFRNILINTAYSEERTNENEFYVKLITELTTDQIKVLHLFYLRDYKKLISFKNINDFISKNWTSVDESYRFALITELIRYGLISGSQKTTKDHGEGHHLSEFGNRFICYIFQPNETDTFPYMEK